MIWYTTTTTTTPTTTTTTTTTNQLLQHRGAAVRHLDQEAVAYVTISYVAI